MHPLLYIFFPCLPTHPSFSPKLSPKSRLSSLNILNPLLSVSRFCIQGGAIRNWRQPRPLALGAELAQDQGISAPAFHGQLPRPGPAGIRQGRGPPAPGPERAGKFVKGTQIFPSFTSQPHHAILIYIASSPLISRRDDPLSRIWTPFKTEKMGKGGGQSREPGSTAPTHRERESCSY